MTLFSKHKVLLYILKPIKLIDKLDIYIHEFILKKCRHSNIHPHRTKLNTLGIYMLWYQTPQSLRYSTTNSLFKNTWSSLISTDINMRI